MEKWDYQVVLVNKWGKAMRQEPRSGAETWQFEDARATDLVAMLVELGADGRDLIGIDINASYAQGSHSYVGSLYIFQRTETAA
jgi:hypothetical protein